MIMAGTRDAVLRQVHLVNIHGTSFYDLEYAHNDDEQPRRAARRA